MSKRNRHQKRIGSIINQVFQPKEFQIKPIQSSISPEDFEAIKNLLLLIQKIKPEQPSQFEPNLQLVELMKLLTDLATGLWRTRQKMISPETNGPRDEMRRAFRPLESTYQNMLQAGIEIVDRTNQPYVTGLIEKVIAFEPSNGISRDMVIETIKPTILYRSSLLQQGEIIVGTPQSKSNL